jgi:hypothetical protein
MDEYTVNFEGIEIRVINGNIFFTDDQMDRCRKYAIAELIANHQDEFCGYLNKNRQVTQGLLESAYGRYLESMEKK